MRKEFRNQLDAKDEIIEKLEKQSRGNQTEFEFKVSNSTPSHDSMKHDVSIVNFIRKSYPFLNSRFSCFCYVFVFLIRLLKSSLRRVEHQKHPNVQNINIK